MGSIFRTADGFGVTKIYLTGYTGTPLSPIHKNKINKSALGAENFVPWEYHKSALGLIKNLKTQGVKIIGLENNTKAIPLKKFKSKFPLALVLGEEVLGVSKKILSMCDKVVEISMEGRKESLNVSVAFGVAAYQIMQK